MTNPPYPDRPDGADAPGRPNRRVRFLVPAAILALIAGHTLLWRFAATQLESGFADWVAARSAQGWSVTAGQPVRGGWPLAAELSVPDLSATGGKADLPHGLTWKAERVVLHVALLRPRTLTIEAQGQQQLRLSDLPAIPFTADRIRAEIPLEPGVPARGVEIDVDRLRAGLPSGGLTVTRLQIQGDSKPAAPQGEAAVSFTMSAGDIDLPPPETGGSWALGGRIASVVVDGALMGPLPKARTPFARAAGWRDGGGTLDLRRVALGWGPLGLTGSATLALDDHMQPMGAATARIVGQSETLDALAAARTINPRTAGAAKAVLGLLARSPEGGGAPEVEVPLTLQNRGLSLGRIPLARMPELYWQDAP
ncbi:DUF2125 domain-containing protein [Limobrevibacterium gyesilva]|uniref:DUF2125 domain-containing protein n=1 Tax=Limobrevibacterium gyesilva TaxID=2991712 RepID=A0AA41YPL0_9PROT|nr:DUF2125 domain-containing protein [Limobrevibacterium gyesilva]MCW3477764.1 DUF2125 domain-containing protein [Limobrevibacterium gyesilva]